MSITEIIMESYYKMNMIMMNMNLYLVREWIEKLIALASHKIYNSIILWNINWSDSSDHDIPCLLHESMNPISKHSNTNVYQRHYLIIPLALY